MRKDIFVRSEEADSISLGELAQRLAACLEMAEVEEKKSANHRNGHCYRGKVEASDLTVALTDDGRLDVFPYWLSLKRAGKAAKVTESLALKLAEAGFECFVPAGRWKAAEWDGNGQLFTP